MKNRILLLLILTSTTLFAQETESVQIKKTTNVLYQGILAETKNWYLLIDEENKYYLANIDKPSEEVYDWFVRFKGSQNIYKANPNQNIGMNGGIGTNQYVTLHFTKENEPSDILNFYLEKPAKDSIFLISLADNTTFKFVRIE